VGGASDQVKKRRLESWNNTPFLISFPRTGARNISKRSKNAGSLNGATVTVAMVKDFSKRKTRTSRHREDKFGDLGRGKQHLSSNLTHPYRKGTRSLPAMAGFGIHLEINQTSASHRTEKKNPRGLIIEND